jgi:hypothetical protein
MREGLTKMSEYADKIMLVKTNKRCFISDCFASSGYDYQYHRGKTSGMYFDGEAPATTFLPNWFYISKYPKKVEIKKPGAISNQRYVINDEKYISEAFPAVIPKEDRENYSEAAMELYKYQYDQEPEYFEEVTIEIQNVMEVENFELPPQISFEGIHKWNYSDTPYAIKNVDIKHQMLDKMIFPEVLLHSRPCSFSSKQVYDITRQHVIQHIDNAVAKITSNYDFCFTVKKIIPVTVPEKITYHNMFARTKRERQKLHTSVKQFNEHEIFEMTSKEEHYQGYTPIPAMTANSEVELTEKMKLWLDSLVEEINIPLCECPHCQGKGFFVDTAKIKPSYEAKEMEG